VRFREDRPGDLDRARREVAAWRGRNPHGTDAQMLAALGPRFHPGYGPVLHGALFAVDRNRARQVTRIIADAPGEAR
jgi:hypothetical protein